MRVRLPFVRSKPVEQTRSDEITFNSVRYRVMQTLTQSGSPVERPSAYGDLAFVYQNNPIVFALVNLRARLFSEMVPKWRSTVDHKLFGDQALAPLERPWPGARTSSLLTRMLLDVDMAGNAYLVRGEGGRLYRLRPDGVSIVIDSPGGGANAADASVVGYRFAPFGGAPDDTVTFLPEEVAHWAPTPNPALRFSGMSWIASALGDIYADSSMSAHLHNYFTNGATPNMLVTLDADNPEDFAEGVAAFNAAHKGGDKAHGTLFLATGSSAQPIGSDLKSVDFGPVQGKSETRIAAAAGVPPSLAGLSEGLAATNYGSNYTASRRAYSDTLLRPLWRSACAALETLLDKPAAAELWYDEADIPFLQDDLIDASKSRQMDAATMASLIVAGFTPESARDSVIAGDASLLQHSGLVPVQLQDPTPGPTADEEASDDA